MLKRHVVFGQEETDKRLLSSTIKALEDPVLKARYDFSIEYDDSTGKTTLWFWKRTTGGFDAK